MSQLTIDLAGMPYDVMLVIEHPSGVTYKNQVGGVTCWQAELEGVLAPLDVGDDDVERIMGFRYKPGHGLSVEHADAIDAILAAKRSTRHVTVDRLRLAESLEAWVHVTVATENEPASGLLGPSYFGAVFGFGRVTGVLVWLNSD
jgi:Family of unknown function (DUF6210)